VVFEVSAGATKTQIKEAVQQIFKVKVAGVRTGEFCRQDAPPRPERRLPARLEKAYVKLAEGEKMIEYAENL